MLSGMAVGMAGALAVAGAAGWSDGSTIDHIATVAAATEMGVEGGMLLSRMWSNPALARLAPAVLKPMAEKVLPAVGIGLDAWNALDAFRDGNYGRAGLHVASMAGGVLMVAGLGPVGVIAGGALVLGAAIGLTLMDGGDDRRKAREAFLIDAGFDPAVASRLASAPEGRMRQLQELGFDYQEIVDLAEADSILLKGDVSSDRLNELKALGLNDAQIRDLERTAFPALLGEVPLGNFVKFAQAMGMTGDQVMAFFQQVGPDHLVELFRLFEGVMPPGEGTREDWAWTLQSIAYAAGRGGQWEAEAMMPWVTQLMNALGVPMPGEDWVPYR